MSADTASTHNWGQRSFRLSFDGALKGVGFWWQSRGDPLLGSRRARRPLKFGWQGYRRKGCNESIGFGGGLSRHPCVGSTPRRVHLGLYLTQGPPRSPASPPAPPDSSS